MQIVFTEHAAAQLTPRSEISVSMIISTVRDPDDLQRSYRDRKVYTRMLDDVKLWVVTTQEHDKIIVITQYIEEAV